jgi:hypothetical protein
MSLYKNWLFYDYSREIHDFLLHELYNEVNMFNYFKIDVSSSIGTSTLEKGPYFEINYSLLVGKFNSDTYQFDYINVCLYKTFDQLVARIRELILKLGMDNKKFYI